jgi:hypothetical protein
MDIGERDNGIQDAGMIERLLQDHDKMRALAQDISAILRNPTPTEMERLAELSWDMASTIMSHLVFEDRAFYSKIDDDPRAHVRALAQRFRAELTERFGAYSIHAKNWTPARIVRYWNGYLTCTLEFLGWLVDREHREEIELFPMIMAGMVDTTSRNLTPVSWAREAFTLKESITGI